MVDECVIWGSGFPARTSHTQAMGRRLVYYSARAGGGYQITDSQGRTVFNLSDQEKARLSTWIVDQDAQGVLLPEVTPEIVEYVKKRSPLPVHERAERLLRWIASQAPTVAHRYFLTIADSPSLAWSESVTFPEVQYFLDYLEARQWLSNMSGLYTVTVDGYRHIETISTNALSSQVFVAMWFDDSMKEVRQKGIMPGVEDAGYRPYLVDDDELSDKIDDKIISEIRRSRFLVADFTHGPKGARGGVYFEAGFALALGIPVIFCCREDQIEEVHFDTRQYNHILWTTPEELRSKLADRIGARLGRGPGTLVNS